MSLTCSVWEPLNKGQADKHPCNRNKPSSDCTLNSLCGEGSAGKALLGQGFTWHRFVAATRKGAPGSCGVIPPHMGLLLSTLPGEAFTIQSTRGKVIKDLAQRQTRLKVKTISGSGRMDTVITFRCLNDQSVKYNWDYQQINHHHKKWRIKEPTHPKNKILKKNLGSIWPPQNNFISLQEPKEALILEVWL